MSSIQIDSYYQYDPLDRLVSCTPATEAACKLFYCKNRLATEIQEIAQRTLFQGSDHLLAQHQCEGGKVNTSMLVTDMQRSVLQVLSSNERSQSAYTAYGYHRVAGGGGGSSLGFNGERQDFVTGYYLLGNGYRAFSPILMRFNSPDSFSPFGNGGLNSYAYCFGDPINFTDSNGRMPNKVLSPALKLAVRKSLSKSNRVDDVWDRVPKHMRPKWESIYKGSASEPLRRTKSLSDIPHGGNKDFDFKELVGYHGSDMKNTDSLHSGINPEKIWSGGYFGDGFYSTPTYQRTVHYGKGNSPSKRFGVYVENQKNLKEGRDYMFRRSPDSSRHGDYIELVIHPPAYHLVSIRAIDIRGQVVLPRPYEAPF